MTLGEENEVADLTGSVADMRVDNRNGAPSSPPYPYIGTPSYPAVLDHIARRRPQQDTSMASVDLAGSDRLQSRSPEIVTLEKFQGNGMNDVSFAQGFSRGSFLLTSDDPQRPSSALSQSWRFHSFVGNAEIGVLFPTTIRNPNKALVTVDGDTKILIANEMACELFDYTHDRLVGMKLKDLFVSPFQEKQDSLIEEHIDSSGKTIMVNGKVV
jgi:PAS domain-containing serine/threonine kinase